MEPINAAGVTQRFSGDMELLQKAAGSFRRSYPVLLDRLRDAVRRGEFEDLELTAHTIRQSVANLGGTAAEDAAFRLEQMGRAHEIQNAIEACAALESEIERFVPALLDHLGACYCESIDR